MVSTPLPSAFETPAQLNQIEPAYSDSEWRKGRFLAQEGDSFTLSADNAYCHMVEMPAVSANLAIIERLRPSREISIKFYGLGANNATYTGKIWGVKNGPLVKLATGQQGREFFGDILGAFTATLGAAQTHADSAMFDQQYRFADTVAFSTDYSITPGILAVGDAADCAIVSVLDRYPGYSRFIIEVDVSGSATGAGFLYAN